MDDKCGCYEAREHNYGEIGRALGFINYADCRYSRVKKQLGDLERAGRELAETVLVRFSDPANAPKDIIEKARAFLDLAGKD